FNLCTEELVEEINDIFILLIASDNQEALYPNPKERLNTCLLIVNGLFNFCFKISIKFSPRNKIRCVCESKLELSFAKLSTSRYCANSIFDGPETFFIIKGCAAEPT